MIKDEIREAMKNAMRAHESARLGTIRLLLAAIKQREIDDQIDADDAIVLEVITKMIKQRRDSIEQYQQANRQDLADKEIAEVDVLQAYLPKALTQEELDSLITQALATVGMTGMAAMGKVMAIIKPQITGRADMGKVSAMVKSKLM